MYQKKSKICLTISQELLEKIDGDRDLVSRSAYIQRILEKFMGMKI